MRNFLLSSLVLIIAFKAQAITSVNFFLGGQAMVNVVSSSMDGHTDQDPVELYKMMNVPPKNSIMGPGKAIVTDNRDLNMTCGTPPGRGATCSFVFQGSSRTQLNPLSKTVSFRATGSDAVRLSKLFVTNDGKLEFISSDRMLRISISDQDIRIEVTGN